MVDQGFETGECLVEMSSGRPQRACRATLREKNGLFSRLIKSAHLSRPEHYYSVYQSGCNHSCLKCHSWDFSMRHNGAWYTTEQLAEMARAYERHVTVWEPRERLGNCDLFAHTSQEWETLLATTGQNGLG